MLGNVIVWLVVVLLAVGCGWLALRAWRARNPLVKFAGTLGAALAAIVLALVSVLIVVGFAKFYLPPSTPPSTLKVAATPEQIARGQHIAAMFCVGCHSTNNQLPMTGGLNMGNDLPVPLGDFISVNLTPAGPLKDWSDGEILRVLRQGVSREGRLLPIMATQQSRYMSDADLEAIIAYLRSQPAAGADSGIAPDQPTVLAFVFLASGLIPLQPPVTTSISAPAKGPTAEYGEYVVGFSDCASCHGADLNGGTGGLAPKGPNLRASASWTSAQFAATLRTGVTPSGHPLAETMPWKSLGRMADDELSAVHAFLRRHFAVP